MRRRLCWIQGGVVSLYDVFFNTTILSYDVPIPGGAPDIAVDYYLYVAGTGDINSAESTSLTVGTSLAPVDLDAFTTETLTVPTLGAVSVKVYKFTQTHGLTGFTPIQSVHTETLSVDFATSSAWNFGARVVLRNAYGRSITTSITFFADNLFFGGIRRVNAGGLIDSTASGPGSPITQMRLTQSLQTSILGGAISNSAVYAVGVEPAASLFPIVWRFP